MTTRSEESRIFRGQGNVVQIDEIQRLSCNDPLSSENRERMLAVMYMKMGELLKQCLMNKFDRSI